MSSATTCLNILFVFIFVVDDNVFDGSLVYIIQILILTYIGILKIVLLQDFLMDFFNWQHREGCGKRKLLKQ